MNSSKDFKKGDVVEYAYDGNFAKYKGSNSNREYDIGTVIQTTPYIKVLWKSDNETTGPLLDNIRLFKDEVYDTHKSPEEYYLCMTKEEVYAFLSACSRFSEGLYASEFSLALDTISSLIAFKNKAKESKEKEEQIQKALELLSNSGYTCTKNQLLY